MRVTAERVGELRARVTVYLHTALNALDRRAATHALGRAGTRALVRAALRRIEREPSVRSVYARGSHGRGDFVPLASDLDLAVVLREPGGKPEFAATLPVVKALDRLRRWNPLVRDPWQMLVGETEWPLVERHANQFQLEEWRDRQGRAPEPSRHSIDERLALAAMWIRLHLWTDTALRHVLAPVPLSASRGLAFAAAEKKCGSLAAQLNRTTPPRGRRPPPRGEEEAFRRAAALLEGLEEAASQVAVRSGLDVPATLPRARAAQHEPERAVIETIRRTCSVPLSRVVLHSGLIAVVMRDGDLDPEERVALVRDLARAAHKIGRRCVVYSPLSLSLAPIYEPMRVLHLDLEGELGGVPTPPEPLLLHEQLLYAALFMGTELRGAAARPLGHPGLDYFTQRLARLLVYFESGALIRDGTEALTRLGLLRPDLKRGLDEATGRSQRFAADAAIFKVLVESLRRSAESSRDGSTA